MFYLSLSQPVAKVAGKKLVLEVISPTCAVLDSSLGQTAIQIQQADKSGPCSAPVCNGQNRASVRDQSAQYMVAVLPHCFRYDERSIFRDRSEYFQTHLLTIDKSWSLV